MKVGLACGVMTMLALSLGACSSSGPRASPTVEVFGLDSACAPLAANDEVLVSPGELHIDQDGQIARIRVIVRDPEGVFGVTPWLAETGLPSGSLVSMNDGQPGPEPLLLTPLSDFVADAPGVWTLALTVPRSEPIRVTFDGIEYDLNGQTYRIDDQFVFEMPCPD